MVEFRPWLHLRQAQKRKEETDFSDLLPWVESKTIKAGNTIFKFPSSKALEAEGLKILNAIKPEEDEGGGIRRSCVTSFESLKLTVEYVEKQLQNAKYFAENGPEAVSEESVINARSALERARFIAEMIRLRFDKWIKQLAAEKKG